MKKIKVLVKEPGKEPILTEIEDKLESYQQLVNGYIETVPFKFELDNDEDEIDIVLNEEGKLIGMKPNIVMPEIADVIVGPIVIVGCSFGVFKDIPEERIEEVKEYLKENAL